MSSDFEDLPVDASLTNAYGVELQPNPTPTSQPPTYSLKGTSVNYQDHMALSMEMKALEALRKVLKRPQATWSCPQQKEAVLAVLELKKDVLAIMRTGSGKSMLMILPTLLEEGQITVGILPLNSLIADYTRRLKDMGVGFELYEGRGCLLGQHNLILVSADRVKTPMWRQALMELHQRRTVVRMVFDEAHFVFTASNFRQSLLNVHEVRILPVQLVILSGTIPLQSQELTVTSFGLRDPLIIRTLTIRPEIRYVLEPPRASNQDIVSRVKAVVAAETVKFTSEDRALVFVPYLDQGETIASSLGCDFYHSSKGQTAPEVRQRQYDDWIAGKHNVMVCSSAFGAGNDYSHVRLIVHGGSPREMIGYTQEKSRAGRDGQPALAIIIPRKNVSGPPAETPPGAIDHKGVAAMYNMLYKTSPTTCLRYLITAFCDGIGTSCQSHPSYQLCSGCLKSQKPSEDCREKTPSSLKRSLGEAFGQAYEDSKQRHIEQLQGSSECVKKMHDALSFYVGHCTYCAILHPLNTTHKLFQCPHLLPEFQKYKEFRKAIHYGPHHPRICWFCHVPQYHGELHAPFSKDTANVCQFGDIIAPIGYLVFTSEKLLKAAAQFFGGKWVDKEGLMAWINDKPIQGHESNLAALFLWCHSFHMDGI
jgi:superfamily II DNA helicase RecQ